MHLFHGYKVDEEKFTELGEVTSLHKKSVGWENEAQKVSCGCDSVSFNSYIVISIPQKKEEELKKVGVKLSLKDNMKVMQAWMDNGSPVSILLIGELNLTLGAQIVQLSPMDPEDDKIRDYGNHPQKMMGKMNATLHSTGCKASTRSEGADHQPYESFN